MDITLLSNSDISKKMYPENTAAKWKTRFPETIELKDGDHEMAMKEIQVPCSFFNVNDTDYYVEAFTLDYDDEGDPIRVDLETKKLPKGNYTDVQHLMTALNAFSIVKKNVYFKYEEDSGRVEVCDPKRKKKKTGPEQQLADEDDDDVNDSYIKKKVDLSPKLRAMLGFKTGAEDKHDDDYDEYGALINVPYLRNGFAPRPVNLYVNVRQQLFVYCDVLEPQIVGDKEERVLRVVGLDDVTQFGRLIVKTYDNPDYVPILKPSFDTIEIDIRTYDDLPAPFEFGPSLVKVHIRKRQRGNR
jgi:hypothetical protein